MRGNRDVMVHSSGAEIESRLMFCWLVSATKRIPRIVALHWTVGLPTRAVIDLDRAVPAGWQHQQGLLSVPRSHEKRADIPRPSGFSSRPDQGRQNAILRQSLSLLLSLFSG
jgi:hypothetical protein